MLSRAMPIARALAMSVALGVATFAGCTSADTPDSGRRCDLYQHGRPCSTPGETCENETSCTPCGNGYYVFYAQQCSCQGSSWFCPHPDCFAPGPHVYESGCAVLASDHSMPHEDAGARDARVNGGAVDAVDDGDAADEGVDAVDAGADSFGD